MTSLLRSLVGRAQDNFAHAATRRRTVREYCSVTDVLRLQHSKVHCLLPVLVSINNSIVCRVAEQLGFHGTRTNGDKTNVHGCTLLPQNLGDTSHSILCSTVHCVVGEPLQASDGRDVDDGSGLPRFHSGENGAKAVDDTANVDLKHEIELGLLLCDEIVEQHNASVVHQAIHGAMLGLRSCDGGFDGSAHSDVALHRRDQVVVSVLLFHLLQAAGQGQNGVTARSECTGARLTDARRGSGDDNKWLRGRHFVSEKVEMKDVGGKEEIMDFLFDFRSQCLRLAMVCSAELAVVQTISSNLLGVG